MKFGQGLDPPPLRALAEFKRLFFKDGFPYQETHSVQWELKADIVSDYMEMKMV